MSFFNPQGGSYDSGDNMDPDMAKRLAMLLQSKQTSPTAYTPFQGAANAGSQLLNTYLMQTLKNRYSTPQPVTVTPKQTTPMSGLGYDWMQLKNMFGLGAGQ